MRTIFFLLLITGLVTQVPGQPQSPADFLGYEPGTRFTSHHQVIDYFEHLALESPGVQLKPYGETYENRPLILAFVSTEANLKRLETIREGNIKRAGLMNGSPSTEVSIVWLSYNVHGNESASTEAAMSTVYELVREGSQRADWLENVLVIIDPCVNPDGRERYVNFYRERGNQPYNPDPASWEHREPWPGGRANHYLFDLNRDWAWQTQIESQQRLTEYNRWLPHIHVDFHEQGINEPYYFAPAAEPFHELITDWQRHFQVEIGKNHARYFDQNNWLYFTKQYFDLLYPSYGDTYPMYNGAIGMTYEQGGSGRAGLGVIKQEGDTLTLIDRLAHHYTTGLSTIEMTARNHERILREFSRFYGERSAATYQTYVIKYRGEDDLLRQLQDWLDAQGIRYGSARNQKGLTGYHYGSGEIRPFSITEKDLVISVNQPKSVLTTVLFEPQTRLVDSLTYDITAWAVPYAFGLEAFATSAVLSVADRTGKNAGTEEDVSGAYGFIFEWKSMDDARLLTAFLRDGITLRYTTKPLVFSRGSFERGSFIVTKRDNPQFADFELYIKSISEQFEEKATALETGFMTKGPDLGSDDIRYLKPPAVALVGGEGTSSLGFGAIWHFFEQELNTLSPYCQGIILIRFD